ncbi:hypothetical protein ACN261_22025 [Micromonospora sp. WMMD723]
MNPRLARPSVQVWGRYRTRTRVAAAFDGLRWPTTLAARGAVGGDALPS